MASFKTTTISHGNVRVSYNPWGRLHVGNRYVWVNFHPALGPTFTLDREGTKPYTSTGKDDPLWAEFSKWLEKYRAAESKRDKQRANTRPTVS